MTVYSLFTTIPTGTSNTSTGARTDSIVFEITSASGSPTLTAVGWYASAGETSLTGSAYTALVYTTTTGTAGTLVTSNAGSGTFTAGAWNFITLTSPVTLSTGVFYVAAISSVNLLEFEHSMWGASGQPFTGGVTSGPVFAPDQGTAPGGIQQGSFSAATTFPSSTNGSWYGVDVQVTVSSGDATVNGVTAALALAAPAGSIMADATVNGVTAALSLTAPAGTAQSNAVTISGPVAQLALAAPAGTAGLGTRASVPGMLPFSGPPYAGMPFTGPPYAQFGFRK